MPELFLAEHFQAALLGGICIGLASIAMMIFLGRIAGISGITWQAASAPLTNLWAVLFVFGLMIGAFAYHALSGQPVPRFETPLPILLAGGFIVGLGTRLGSGCTSGHGICGIGRLSPRSLVATATFIGFGFLTVFLVRHVAGGAL